MIYCFDLDGTICETEGNDYDHSRPIPEMILAINRLFATGHRILIYTARGMGSGINWEALTEEQLVGWGIDYHELKMRKPSYDVWIDDKAVNVKDWLKAMAIGESLEEKAIDVQPIETP